MERQRRRLILVILIVNSIEADLGKFSEAIYKKVMGDAKQQRFQGFRPGTIPPHIEPTYRAFCLDECARETVLEALEQNNIRPFSDCRTDLEIQEVSIPLVKSKNKKKKKGGKKKKGADESAMEVVPSESAEEEAEPQKQARKEENSKGEVENTSS